MKGYYLFAPVEPACVGPFSGVERKVRAQHRVLSKSLDCELVILPVTEFKRTAMEKIIRRLPYTAAWRKWEYHGEFDDADFLYIRQVYHDYSFVKYLRSIKKSNPNTKIIYEVPTYPYDDEKAKSASSMLFDIKERKNRLKLAKYVDAIVTFYGQKEIWGIPCIDIYNGYDFSQVELPSRKLGDTIEILSVSATGPWHGYDRIIEGINNYYKNGGKENIVYHLIGDKLTLHEQMVEKYGLQDHVILHGRMSGEHLEEIYKRSVMGVDILAGFRRQSEVSSTLKSREYAAWGLPIITASPVDYLPDDYKYLFFAPYDETPIDIEKLVKYYHEIYDNKSPDEIAKEIRDYAESKCDMSVTMQPVVDWLENK